MVAAVPGLKCTSQITGEDNLSSTATKQKQVALSWLMNRVSIYLWMVTVARETLWSCWVGHSSRLLPESVTGAKGCDYHDSVQFSSVAQSCPTLCNPMDCSTPGFPVHHQLLEPAQTHVHRVSDAIQPSHPLSSPSPPAFNLSQHQGLSQWLSWLG